MSPPFHLLFPWYSEDQPGSPPLFPPALRSKAETEGALTGDVGSSPGLSLSILCYDVIAMRRSAVRSPPVPRHPSEDPLSKCQVRWAVNGRTECVSQEGNILANPPEGEERQERKTGPGGAR